MFTAGAEISLTAASVRGASPRCCCAAAGVFTRAGETPRRKFSAAPRRAAFVPLSFEERESRAASLNVSIAEILRAVLAALPSRDGISRLSGALYIRFSFDKSSDLALRALLGFFTAEITALLCPRRIVRCTETGRVNFL